MTPEFRVLGPVEVLRDGLPVALGGAKPRSALALLVANRDHVVSVTALADALWGEDLPADPAASVQQLVSSLRRALAPDGGVLQTAPPGYRLAVPAQWTDLGRFLGAAADARAAGLRGDHPAAANDFARALAEWRGPAWDDLRGSRHLADLAAALDEQRLLAIEGRVTADLACGRHRETVAELAELTAAHPLREGLWALAMTALYRCGRQADALAAYQAVRARLDDELGLQPSPALRDLHAAILRQDPTLLAPQRPLHDAAETQTQTDTGAVQVPAWLETPDGARVPIHGRLRLGRTADNGLVVADPKASRRHAEIHRAASGLLLSDLASRNGTRVNGLPVANAVLQDGDRIGIGDSEFVVRLG